MRDPDEFDAFYKDARTRLLLQTYALTGDLPAARVAVRDAFVVAWHHWAKATRDDDPEAWTRPIAWAHAQRRHTARIWHREKGLGPDVHALLEALGKLSVDQRKMLLLTVLASGTIADFAREVGLTREDAERELQTAVSQLGVHLGSATPVTRALFAPLAEVVEDVRLPRASILRRAGAARRRTHTTLGVVAAVAALVVTGTAVTDAGGVRPSLDRGFVSTSGPADGERSPAPPEPPALSEDALLTADQLSATLPGRAWTEGATSDNTEGDGLAMPCQVERYADPRSIALVRDFTATTRRRDPARSAVQLVEASASTRAGHRAYRTTLDWFAGCRDDRTQLLATRQVGGVGDEAMLLTLRDWDDPATTLVAGVARTGQLTTTTVASVASDAMPEFRASGTLLEQAVTGLCGLPDAGACVTTPTLEAVPPLPVGEAPAMLATVDLPPVATVTRPWAGTEPRQARQNLASTRCDQARFRGEGWSSTMTRTFLVPDAQLPPEFGLTETVGARSRPQARAFVEDVRDAMRTCPEDDLGTDVVQIADRRTGPADLTVWKVTTEVSDKQTVEFRMAIMRTGTAVAQLGFVPSGDARMTDDAFVALAERALERLTKLPPPS